MRMRVDNRMHMHMSMYMIEQMSMWRYSLYIYMYMYLFMCLYVYVFIYVTCLFTCACEDALVDRLRPLGKVYFQAPQQPTKLRRRNKTVKGLGFQA